MKTPMKIHPIQTGTVAVKTRQVAGAGAASAASSTCSSHGRGVKA
jgi:hypothetical protein